MYSLKTLLFGAVAVTAAVVPRDAAAVEQSIVTINDDLVSLTNVTNNYNGGLLPALPVRKGKVDLVADIQACVSVAESTPQLGPEKSKKIISYIDSTLEPNIVFTLDAFVNKQAAFQKAGLAGTVGNIIGNLKGETVALGEMLVKIAADGTKAKGKESLETITADFDEAIAIWERKQKQYKQQQDQGQGQGKPQGKPPGQAPPQYKGQGQASPQYKGQQ